MRVFALIALAALMAQTVHSATDTGTGTATATTAATTAAGTTATCSTVGPLAVPVIATSKFTISGNIGQACTNVTLTFKAAPTTVPTTTGATTTLATTTVAVTTSATTATTATETTATTQTTQAPTTTQTTQTPATTLPPATTAPFLSLNQPLLPSTSTTSRDFYFSPLNIGSYDVQLICAGITVTTACGTFFSSAVGPVVTFTFSAALPTEADKLATFKTNFANAVAAAAKIDASQVINLNIPTTRRRAAGSSLNANFIGTASSNDPNNALDAVKTAASNGNLNTELQKTAGVSVTSIAVNGATVPIATAAPVTPPPSTASVSSVCVFASVVIALLSALLF